MLHPAVEVTLKVFEILLGIFFVPASAGYWIFERGRAVDFVASLLPRPKRKKLRDTWDLIDLKLGAFVRGQALLIVLVGTVLSLAFWAIGEPYFILIGAFAGVVEIVPVIGPPCSMSSSAMSTRQRKTCRPCSSRPRTPRRRTKAYASAETIAASRSPRRKGLIRCATGSRERVSSLGGEMLVQMIGRSSSRRRSPAAAARPSAEAGSRIITAGASSLVSSP